MKKYALSERGAKDLIWATLANTVFDLSLFLPVDLLYLLVSDMLGGQIPTGHYWIYVVGIAVSLLLIFLTSLLSYNKNYYATYIESGKRRISLAERLRKLPLSFFGKRDLSDLTTAILTDCTKIETALSHTIPEFFGAIISTVIAAVGLFVFDWRMALAAVWVLPVSLAVVAFSKRVQNYFTRRTTEATLDVSEGLQECLENMRELKCNNAEESYLNGLTDKIKKSEKRSVIAELGSAAFVVPAGMILKVGIATTALVGSALLLSDTLTPLTFFAFLMVVSRIYEPMNAALMHLAAINSLQVNIDRMNELNDYPLQTGSEKFSPNGYDVEFKDVDFSYNAEESVLKGVSFTAKQGEVTALIGESGGGKSTASRLAARFWDYGGGKITVGGVDVKSVDPEKLLSVYSIVFQDVTLFNNTVKENIRIGKKGATDEEVLAAAKAARCDEFVEKLPRGYDTPIGENGAMLSGGERQRVSIARALLKDAPIILLDEATASLDAENESKVQEAISRLIKDKTVIIIAHRMRTVEGADKLVVLKGGKVAEIGTPAELKAKGGMFAEMLKAQSEAAEWKL